MPRQGSDDVTISRERLRLATRSPHQATYLTREQLDLAPQLTLVEKNKAQSGDIKGTSVEQMLADLLGGQWIPKAKACDLIINGVGYAVKTRLLTPPASRPAWTDQLLTPINIKMNWLQPVADFPSGQNILNASATVIGRRLCDAYNQMLVDYEVERIAFLVRIADDREQVHRYLYWTTDCLPLDPADYRWKTTQKTVVSHSIAAVRKGADNEGSQLTWASSGCSLFMRHLIPADADTWVVPFSQVKSREQVNRVLLADAYN
jgi:hypothetical protein